MLVSERSALSLCSRFRWRASRPLVAEERAGSAAAAPRFAPSWPWAARAGTSSPAFDTVTGGLETIQGFLHHLQRRHTPARGAGATQLNRVFLLPSSP